MNFDVGLLAIQLLLITASVALLVIHGRRMAAAAPEPVDNRNRPPISRTRHAGELLAVAAWFGLTTGVLHVLLALVNHFGRDRLIFASPAMLG